MKRFNKCRIRTGTGKPRYTWCPTTEQPPTYEAGEKLEFTRDRECVRHVVDAHVLVAPTKEELLGAMWAQIDGDPADYTVWSPAKELINHKTDEFEGETRHLWSFHGRIFNHKTSQGDAHA